MGRQKLSLQGIQFTNQELTMMLLHIWHETFSQWLATMPLAI